MFGKVEYSSIYLTNISFVDYLLCFSSSSNFSHSFSFSGFRIVSTYSFRNTLLKPLVVRLYLEDKAPATSSGRPIIIKTGLSIFVKKGVKYFCSSGLNFSGVYGIANLSKFALYGNGSKSYLLPGLLSALIFIFFQYFQNLQNLFHFLKVH